MTPKPRRKATKPTNGAEPPVREPSWRQQGPPKKRRKVRQNETAVPALAIAPRVIGKLRVPRVRLHVERRFLVALPFLAAVIFGLVQVFTNDYFFVFQAQIQGNQRVAAEAIYAASQVDGKSIFWIQPGAVSARVAELAGVAAVRTHVRLPNRVIIDVQEHAPLAVWQVGNQAIWVGDNGQPLPEVGTPPALHLTDATGAAAVPAAAGKQSPPQLRPQILAGLLALHKQQPELTDIYYGSEEGLYFRTPQGWTVYLGSQGDIAARLSRLQAVQQQMAKDETLPKIVDLRIDGAAFYH